MILPLLLAAATALTPAERAAAQAAGADPRAVVRLIDDAAKARTERLIVVRNGGVVLDRKWGPGADALHPLMQLTTVFSALAVGCLVADGKIRSLDAPVNTWIPRVPASITLRDLVEGGRTGSYDKGPIGGLYAKRDMVAYYAGLEILPSRGRPSGDDDAAVLLAPIVKAMAGEPIDAYLARRLFAPMKITKTRWRKDAAGNCDTATGLWLRPTDLLRFGELIRREGEWKGRQLVPADWIRRATTPARAGGNGLDTAAPDAQTGHYWKAEVRCVTRPADLARLRKAGFPAADALAPIVGRVFPGTQAWITEAYRLTKGKGYHELQEAEARYGGMPFGLFQDRDRYGFSVADFVGQMLFVNPGTGVVMVRTVPWSGKPVGRSEVQFEFDDVDARTDALFGPPTL